MNKIQRPKSRNFLYGVISLFFLFIIIEVILSVFFFHKNSDERLATIEAIKLGKSLLKGRPNSINVENQKRVRSSASEEHNRQIATETHLSNKFRYQSWVEFSNIDYKGEYVNVTGGMRRTIPGSYYNPGSKDTVTIYFFGGSTTFGFNVADEETLPSQFVRLYKEQFPGGKSVQVHNYGTPTYYTYQELIQYANLIFQGHRPDIVIFLDGVNDFWFARASYYNQSYFSPVFRQIFKQDVGGGGKFLLKDSSKYMYRDPDGISTTTFNDQLIANYFNSLQNVSMLAAMTGGKSYFFCQPVPFYKYPRQSMDSISFHDQHTRFDYIYPLIEKRKDTLINFTFLGNMLQDEKGYPFVDGLHYSPAFTKKVSQAILDKVSADLK